MSPTEILGWRVAKNARKELESKTGKSVVSERNFLGANKNGGKLKKKN